MRATRGALLLVLFVLRPWEAGLAHAKGAGTSLEAVESSLEGLPLLRRPVGRPVGRKLLYADFIPTFQNPVPSKAGGSSKGGTDNPNVLDTYDCCGIGALSNCGGAAPRTVEAIAQWDAVNLCRKMYLPAEPPGAPPVTKAPPAPTNVPAVAISIPISPSGPLPVPLEVQVDGPPPLPPPLLLTWPLRP
eukprot:jgi/Botrbrau1/16152/Bobra.0309s0002.1